MTGAQIRAARGFLNCVRDLGKKANLHFNTVHAIEHGKSHGKPETLAAKVGVQFTNGKRPGVRIGAVSRLLIRVTNSRVTKS